MPNAHYEKYKEAIKANTRRYTHAPETREKFLEAKRRWKEANQDKMRMYTRKCLQRQREISQIMMLYDAIL